MDKKENFKEFISNHPELLNYIKNKEMTFQDFFEIYDIYGEDEATWSKYFKEQGDDLRIKELSKVLKNINMDSIEHHVNNAQKVIGIIQELTKKSPDVVSTIDNPITKIYGD
ncbi:MAG: hypothetical protein J1F35_00950 [Erysipelotrichales bacterium]|nr:hypothetical protein [Erysipelotrichales bacterium]